VFFNRKPKQSPEEVVGRLRAQILELDPAQAGLSQSPDLPNVWAILMETGYPDAVASLVAVADGTVSLYFSNGGGVIGAGQHDAVLERLPTFFEAAETHLSDFKRATTTPMPNVGRVRFYLRTFNGTLTAEAAEEDLGYERHELSPVFHAGHYVISAVREASEANRE